MPGPRISYINPPQPLTLPAFDAAVAMLGAGETYTLCCHDSNIGIAEQIQDAYKQKNQEVDVIVRTAGHPGEWFVHGVHPGVPAIVSTVFSHVTD